jgi:hypothetical protein
MVRWRKGWATVLLLGAAYGILEEGIAVDTFFYSHASPVGALGFYGHWLGVNWVWATELVMFHALVSISLPIFLLGLALPETRGRSLLTDRQVALVVAILAIDVTITDALVASMYHFWPGPWLTLGALAVIAGLAVVAYLVPPDFLRPSVEPPKGSLWVCWLLGALLLTGSILIESLFGSARVPAALAVVTLAAMYSLILAAMIRAAGSSAFVRPRLAFVVGNLTPVMVVGIVAEAAFPALLVADALAIGFVVFLWKKYPFGASAPVRAAVPRAAP